MNTDSEMSCLKCAHVKHVQPDPNVLKRIYVCIESPPVPIAGRDQYGGISVMSMFPPVQESMYCSKFKPLESKKDQKTDGNPV